MNMKNIIALAAVAAATVASASTNYVEVAAKRHSLVFAVREMANDFELAEPAAFHSTLEALDEATATGAVTFAWQSVSRRCPLTAQAVLGKTECFTARAKKDMLAVCGTDAANYGLGLRPKEDGFLNFAVQAACLGNYSAAGVRNAILNAAIVPTRRKIRTEGGTFVGEEGAKKVKEILDALAAELNAPRFGKAGKIVKDLGMNVEWDFAVSQIIGDDEIAGLKKCLLGGDIPFNGILQNKLCVALGVEAFNAFVKEYNGK